MQYLLFTLAAPLASFGTVSVGERRPSWDRPSKSQIIGLVAGALGIERSEEAHQQALASSLFFAVRIDNPGEPALDYHTTQVPPQRRKRRFTTRRDELAVDKSELKTILSEREFRVGSLYTIGLWPRGSEAACSLEEIKSALERPTFVPFAGRKACPLMLPMRPQMLDATTIESAFAAFDEGLPAKIIDLWQKAWIRRNLSRRIYVDADSAENLTFGRLEERRDIPESRAKWRFGLRTEALLRQAIAVGDQP
jgi:CRISPR system Cascade subunit CasD